jgi:hypothetical protein
MTSDATTFTIEGDDGSSDELTVPTEMLQLLKEDDDESPAQIVGDLALISCAQRIHGAIHHGHGEAGGELEAIEEATLERFEERFGQTFAEMTGHDH